jgi:DNA-binding IclR family transcriptional regulator
VNIAEAIGPAEIALRTWVGQSCSAHATSSGKVLLAGLMSGEVRKHSNAEVIAGLSVSGPSYRLGVDHFEQVAKQAISAAESISRRLGWVDLPSRR